MSKRDRKGVAIPPDVHATLLKWAESRKLKIYSIIGYLVDECEKYKMLDPDWKDKLLKVSMDEFKRKFDEKLSKELEKERYRHINKISHTLLTQYLKVLSPDERREMIENMLGDLKEGNILDKLSELEMVSVDGKKRFIKVSEGKPDLGVDPKRVVVCNNGYHILGMYCKCNQWRTCEIRSAEYQEYKEKVEAQKPKPTKGAIYIPP